MKQLLSLLLLIAILYCLIKIPQIGDNKKTELHKLNNNLNHFDSKSDIVIPSVLEHGFHDQFAHKNGFSNNKLLGWRYWYLKNKSQYLVQDNGNFEDIPTRNYLDNLPHLENWFYNLYNSKDIEDNIIE